MGEMITKPDANPIVFAICNLFLGGCVGYFLMEQKSKAITGLVVSLVLAVVGVCTFGFGYLFYTAWCIVAAYDAYLLGQKLQNGESIGEKENALDFLGMLPGFK